MSSASEAAPASDACSAFLRLFARKPYGLGIPSEISQDSARVSETCVALVTVSDLSSPLVDMMGVAKAPVDHLSDQMRNDGHSTKKSKSAEVSHSPEIQHQHRTVILNSSAFATHRSSNTCLSPSESMRTA